MKKIVVVLVGLILGISTMSNNLYCEYCGKDFNTLGDTPLCNECMNTLQDFSDYHKTEVGFTFLDGTGYHFTPTDYDIKPNA